MTEVWTAPSVERSLPDRLSGERDALEQWIGFHRATLLMKCQGLTADQLKERALPPSQLSLLGLVRHMRDVERWWFRMHADQQRIDNVHWVGDYEADFHDIDQADAAQDIADYLEEIEMAKAAVAGHELDEVVPSLGHHRDRTRNIRWIYIHMIEEYARHNGHADLLRERIDGETGE